MMAIEALPATYRPNGQHNNVIDRLPPHSIEAEEAVLGSVLIDPEAIYRVSSFLKADYFYIVKNQWAWSACLALHERGEPIDFVTITHELTARNQLDELGGPAYISYLINIVPTAIHAESYGRIVERMALRRQVLDTASELAKSAFDEGELSPITLDKAQRSLDSLRRSSNAGALSDWKFHTLTDAYAERSPAQHLVSGLIVLPSLVILFGAPGTLKSLFLAYFAVCVAAGFPFLPPLPGREGVARAVHQSAVIWLDFDNGTRRTLERFKAIGRALNASANLRLHILSMGYPWLNAGDEGLITELIELALARDAKLIVIDNLGVISGGADENSTDMVPIMSNLRRLAEHTGAAVIVVHHQRKSNGFVGRAGETMRGNTAIEAAIDLGLLVEREPHSNLITIRSTKSRDTDVLPFGAEFTFESEEDSEELARATFFGTLVEDNLSDAAIDRAIIETVSDHRPINGTKLVKAVHATLPAVGMNRIRKRANDLVSASRLVSTIGERRSRLYDLA
jgi:hypothetical protein